MGKSKPAKPRKRFGKQVPMDLQEEFVSEEKESAREFLKKRNKGVDRQHFIVWHMWISYLLSLFEKDRGVIPKNIGNRVLITNNMYVTKNYMTSIMQLQFIGLKTPVTLLEELNRELRDKGCSAVLDMTIKNQRFDINTKETGMMSRADMWRKVVNDDRGVFTDVEKERSARCLYTLDLVEEGKQLWKSRVFLYIRGKRGSQLRQAEQIIDKFCQKSSIMYLMMNTNIKDILNYSLILADSYESKVRDMRTIVNTNVTMAQFLPNTNSINDVDDKAIYFANNIQNNSPYCLNLNDITGGRNIYVYAPTGGGKTVLVENIASSAFEQEGWAVSLMDIKGNEFTNFINGTGGYIVSLRTTSQEYFNSFRMYAEEATERNAELYFKNRVDFSKKQMLTLSGLVKTEELLIAEGIFDEFLEALYIQLGVVPDNRNTWKYSDTLNPFKVYDYMVPYLQSDKYSEHHVIISKVCQSFKMYWNKNGSKSYAFRREFEYAKILRSPTVSYDFGYINNSDSDVDYILNNLKFMYMEKLNGEFSAYKYANGIKTLKVLEESQIVGESTMKSYVREFTMRRSQGQTTILLGNSIKALQDNEIAKPLIENVRAIMVGKVPAQDALDTVVNLFGLEDQREIIESIGDNEQMKNSFVFVNRMKDSNGLTPLLKVHFEKGKRYKLFTPVAEKNIQAE